MSWFQTLGAVQEPGPGASIQNLEQNPGQIWREGFIHNFVHHEQTAIARDVYSEWCCESDSNLMTVLKVVHRGRIGD